MAKLKVIAYEILNGKLLVTVEVRKWWANPTTRQFIESGSTFTKHPNKDEAWYTYPGFYLMGWVGDEAPYHELLSGWKKNYLFQKQIEDGKAK